MKIYVATSWKNPFQEDVVLMLRSIGHEVYDFKNPKEGNSGFHWSAIDKDWQTWQEPEYLMALRHEVAEEGFKLDYDAMKWADACVMLLPCGRSAHLEAGWFAGNGKKLFIVLGNENPVVPELMYKMATMVLPGLASLAHLMSQDWTGQ